MKKLLLTTLLTCITSIAIASDYTSLEGHRPGWDPLFKDMLAYGKKDNNVWEERVNTDTMTRMWATMFHYETWKIARNNEFKKHEAMGKARDDLNNTINNRDLDKLYRFNLAYKFGKYDFDKNAFPIIKGYRSNEHRGKFENNHTADFFDKKRARKLRFKLPHNIEVWSIGTMPASFPLNPDKAQAFVESRTNKYGDVDRTLYVSYYFKIKGPGKMYDDHQFSYDWVLKGDIKRVEIYDDKSFDNLIAAFDGDGKLIHRNW